MSTRKSARLQENIDEKDKNIFIVDNEDAPSLNGQTIEENDHWITVWSKLKKAGWGWKQGNAISSYFYTKPNINSIKDKRKDIDYFVKEDHVKKYVEVKYNWSQHQSTNFTPDVKDDISAKINNTEKDEKKTTNKRRICHISGKESTKKHTHKNKKAPKFQENDSENEKMESNSTVKSKGKAMKTIQKNKQNCTNLVEIGRGYTKKKEHDNIDFDHENDKSNSHPSIVSINHTSSMGNKACVKDSAIKVVIGTKTNPGVICFENVNDYRLGRRVAFHLSSMEGREIKKYFKNKLPKDALTTISIGKKINHYILGVVNRKSKRKDRRDFYTVSWDYSCDVMSDIDFQLSVIDRGVALYKSLFSTKHVSPNQCSQGVSPFSNAFMSKLKEFDASTNDGEIIESDDCYSDSDLVDDEDLYFDYNINSEKNTSQTYNKIRKCHDSLHDSKMSLILPNEKTFTRNESIDGLRWEMNTSLDPPAGLGCRPKTSIKHEFRNFFPTELDSLLAFFPLKFWVYHLNESNRYVHRVLENKNPKSNIFYGMKWKPIKMNELMVFYAILIQMSCRPFPGKRYDDCWKYQNEWFTNCQKMNKTRFKQIRAALHWCDNPHSKSSEDTLYKVRPMINILNGTIGKYLNVGESIALDETTVGLYHAYAKALIFYNPAKPRGKHHCKLYTLCENDFWAAFNFKFCHRTYKNKEGNENSSPKVKRKSKEVKSEEDKLNKQKKKKRNETKFKIEDTQVRSSFVETDEESIEIENKEVPRMVQLVTSLCECLRGTGVVVNMDNLYSSPVVFIHLHQMGIFARGTFRSNKKYLPSFVHFSKNEVKNLPRGCFRLATNKEFNLSCYAWNDKNPVHILSSADGTDIDMTKRRSKSEKIDVLCPSAIKRYNLGMQGVDQFNKLLTLFSLANLKFNKYYKKIAMVLLDFGLTNAYIHYKLANRGKLDKKYSRVDFMERLQEQMIGKNWSEKVLQMNMVESEYANSEYISKTLDSDKDLFDKEMGCGKHSIILSKNPSSSRFSMPVVQNICSPVGLQIPSKHDLISLSTMNDIVLRNIQSLPDSKKICQICEFEGRGRKRKAVNMCSYHQIRACTSQNPDSRLMKAFIHFGKKYINFDIDSMDSWLCPDTHQTCWEKAHNFYIPKGLFYIESNDHLFSQNSIDVNKFSRINWNSNLAKLRKKTLMNLAYKREPKNIKEDPINSSHNSMNPQNESPLKPDTVTSLSTITNDFLNQSIHIPQVDNDDI